jgi:hypothetical protein
MERGNEGERDKGREGGKGERKREEKEVGKGMDIKKTLKAIQFMLCCLGQDLPHRQKRTYPILSTVLNSFCTQHSSLLRNSLCSQYQSFLLDLKPTYSGSVSGESEQLISTLWYNNSSYI